MHLRDEPRRSWSCSLHLYRRWWWWSEHAPAYVIPSASRYIHRKVAFMPCVVCAIPLRTEIKPRVSAGFPRLSRRQTSTDRNFSSRKKQRGRVAFLFAFTSSEEPWQDCSGGGGDGGAGEGDCTMSATWVPWSAFAIPEGLDGWRESANHEAEGGWLASCRHRDGPCRRRAGYCSGSWPDPPAHVTSAPTLPHWRPPSYGQDSCVPARWCLVHHTKHPNHPIGDPTVPLSRGTGLFTYPSLQSVEIIASSSQILILSWFYSHIFPLLILLACIYLFSRLTSTIIFN